MKDLIEFISIDSDTSINESVSEKIFSKVRKEILNSGLLKKSADVKKIEDAINVVYNLLDEECYGYIESKRVVKSEKPNSISFKWRVQGIETSTLLDNKFNLRNYIKKRYRGILALTESSYLENDYYDAILKYGDNKEDNEEDYRKHDDYDSILVGIKLHTSYRWSYDAKDKVDKNSDGPTAIIKVFIPKTEFEYLNPYITKKENSNLYFVEVNRNTTAIYNTENNQWSIKQFSDGDGIASADTFNIIYKPNRVSASVFNKINNEFMGNMDLDEFEKTYFNKLTLGHSYYFNPYID